MAHLKLSVSLLLTGAFPIKSAPDSEAKITDRKTMLVVVTAATDALAHSSVGAD